VSAVAVNIGAGNYNGPPLLILVCDDERHIVRLIQVNLERQGHTVVCAFNGEQAIEQIQSRINSESKMFDLIFLDVMMPKKDGFEVLKWVRTHPETENIRVIMKIAKTDDQEVFKDYAHQPDKYLLAPFNPLELLDLR
jgi:two-component system alkaline phosphatase synthesis response regulator PhoP/two-component system response regulator VicR